MYFSGKYKHYKTVFIFRGLPGTGKKTLIDKWIHQHRLKKTDYVICSNDDFFKEEEGNKYTSYNFNQLPQAQNWCQSSYIEALSEKLPYIFISNTNSEYWEYENYTTLAKLFSYKVVIIEIDCPSDNYIEYFNHRASNKLPLSTCKALYKKWEPNNNSIVVPPYESDHEGDSLPFPKTTKAKLDKELVIMTTVRKCSRNSLTPNENSNHIKPKYQ